MREHIHSYELAELLATKLRALYQRKAGRDSADRKWDPQAQVQVVSSRLIERLPGDPSKGGS